MNEIANDANKFYVIFLKVYIYIKLLVWMFRNFNRINVAKIELSKLPKHRSNIILVNVTRKAKRQNVEPQLLLHKYDK